MSDAQKLSSENSTPARRRGWLTYAVVLAAVLMPLGVFAAKKELSKQVEDLAQKRAAYLEEQERLAGAAGERDGFDLSAKRSLKKAVKENAKSGFKL